MGRSPCCDKDGLKKGPWTPEEDRKLIDYIQKNGYGNWRTLPNNAGLQRCGKSCRLRWSNYLRPDIKRGRFSFEEEEAIIHLHSILGNKWSAIAARLPGRTDNEIKNYWNTHIRKRLLRMGIDPVTHCPRLDLLDLSSLRNPSFQMNLSSLIGAQVPYINPELLRLASSLFASQKENQDFPLENQEKVTPHHHFQNQLPPLVQTTQIQTPIQDIPSCTTCLTATTSSLPTFTTWTPFCSEAQMIMQPNGQNISSEISQFSFESCDRYGKWQDSTYLMPSDFQEDLVPRDNNGSYVSDDHVIGSDAKNNFNFESGLSNLSTPSSSPTPLTSSSPYIHSYSTEDERESYCSNLKFNIPENMDDYLFKYVNCLDNTY